MGLIKALTGSVSSTFADQWKEYFYCEALDVDVLVTKGVCKSNNNKGRENIISNGSEIAVADGQCMLIVEQGKVVEVCAEPGSFTYDSSTEPSVFSGDLGTSVIDTFKTIGKRFTFGGEIPKDQRVYYINTKEIMGNKYGTASPIPFRIVDTNIGLDIDSAIRCNGQYSYKITNPLLFYTNVCGNISADYTRDNIDSTLKTELLTALQPAFAKISALGIRYSALPAHTFEITTALNQILSAQWNDLRGLSVGSFGLNSATISEEDQKMIKDLQKIAVYSNPGLAAGAMVDAQAQAMKSAASNTSGAMTAFMGMGMAQNAGGMNANNLFQMAQTQGGQQQAPQPKTPQQPTPQQMTPAATPNSWKCPCGSTSEGKFCNECGNSKPVEASKDSWDCLCGATNTGKFCNTCGKPIPITSDWACSCGQANTGKFCNNCGKPEAVSYRCNKCGFEPTNPTEPPKFCGQCGDIFDENDKK